MGDSCTYPKHAISAGFNFKIGGFSRQNQQKKPKARAKFFSFVHFWILCHWISKIRTRISIWKVQQNPLFQQKVTMINLDPFYEPDLTCYSKVVSLWLQESSKQKCIIKSHNWSTMSQGIYGHQHPKTSPFQLDSLPTYLSHCKL